MCSICGVVSFQPNAPADRSTLLRMNASLQRRGPDDEGYYAVAFRLVIYPNIRDIFLSMPLPIRMGTALLFIFPAGFFMGMPFPLGVLTLQRQPKGSIAWAWGMNGLFTVIGGLFGIVSSIQWGFNLTLLLACVFYALAFWVFSRIRSVLQYG